MACETLTRPAGDAAAFDAEAFAAEWPEEERGLTGAERARAFTWLARELGFACALEHSVCSRPWETAPHSEGSRSGGEGASSSKVNEGVAHRSVVATIDGRRILADAGFPVPLLLPLDLPFEEIRSPFGTLRVAEDAGLRRVVCDARGEVTELLRLGGLPSVGPGGSKSPFATRVLDDRVLHWEAGVMTILDSWSVLRYPLAGTERAAFESLFALDLDGVDLPAVPAAMGPATIAVFHAIAIPPEEARRALVLADPPASLLAGRSVDVVAAPGGSRLASRAVLSEAVPPAGPGESVRKTLVFHLAMELLGAGARG